MPEAQGAPNPPQPTSYTPQRFNWKNALLMFLIGTTVMFAGVSTYYYLQLNSTAPTPQLKPPKVSSPSATPKPEQPTVTSDETAGWKILSNKELGYLIKYPKNWNTKRCTNDSFALFKTTDSFGPTVNDTGICNSGTFGTIFIASGKNYSVVVTKDGFTNYKRESVEIDGVTASKTSGISKGRSDIPDNIYIVEYSFKKEDNKSYLIRFTGSVDDEDELRILSDMLSTFRFD